jgi:hypothetical protein
MVAPSNDEANSNEEVVIRLGPLQPTNDLIAWYCCQSCAVERLSRLRNCLASGQIVTNRSWRKLAFRCAAASVARRPLIAASYEIPCLPRAIAGRSVPLRTHPSHL